MKTVFSALVAAHGAIHLLGFAKALGCSSTSMLQGPTSLSLGILWLSAALGFLVSALLVMKASRDWSIAAAPAVLLSQLLIAICWSSAKWGTVANALIAAPVLFSLMTSGREATSSSRGARLA